MATEQRKQALLEIQTQVVIDAKTNKQKLIAIVLEKTSAEARLAGIRHILLESQLERDPVQPVEDPNVTVSSMMSKIVELPVNQINELAETMKKTFDPAVEQKKLMDEIAQVIRSKELSPDQKIALISDLLI